MLESIELELEALDSAHLSHLSPNHLINFFKEQLNDHLLINLVNDLDNLIHTIDTNNSFKILSLNDRDTSVTDSQNSSLSSSLSEDTLTSCKSLLAEISNKLCEIFRRYNSEINHIIGLFERQQAKHSRPSNTSCSRNTTPILFANRKDILEYQRAILVQKLSTKHYDLLNLLFRNVFDFYQKSCHFEDENTCGDESMNIGRVNKNQLIQNFESINTVIFELELFDHLCGDIVVGVVQNKIRLHIESTSTDNYQESFIRAFEHVSLGFRQQELRALHTA